MMFLLFTHIYQLRKWNERWVILDPTTGKIEYKYGNCRAVSLFAKEAVPETPNEWHQNFLDYVGSVGVTRMLGE